MAEQLKENFPTVRCPSVSIRLVKNKETGKMEAPKRIQVLKTGNFNHPFLGLLVIIPGHMTQMKNNFDAKVVGVDLAVDISHRSHEAAMGWVTSVDLEEDEDQTKMFMGIAWTDHGRKKIEDKQFRYTSVDFEFNFEHNETGVSHGRTLMGLAVTNRPFVSGMEPVVQLTAIKEGDQDMPAQKTIKEVEAELAAEKAKNATLTTENAGLKTAPEKPSVDSAQLATTQAELVAEKEKTAKLESDKAVTDKNAAFDVMLTSGSVCEAQRPSFMEDNMVEFAKNASKVKLTPTGGRGGNSPAGGGEEPKDYDTAEARVIELTKERMSKDNCTELEAQEKVLAENPKLCELMEGED